MVYINNITGNTFNDNATIVKNQYNASESVDFERIEKELQEIKISLKEGSREFQVVDMLEKSSKAHDWNAICSTIGKFTAEFTKSTLANLAGAYLTHRLNLGH